MTDVFEGIAPPRDSAACGPIPGHARVPFHVGIAGEQLTVVVEHQVVGILQSAGEQLDGAAGRVGAKNRAARRLDAHGVTAGVFVARRDQVALVEIVIGTGRLDLGGHVGEVAHDDVQQSVGAQGQGVRAVLADLAGELQNRLDCDRSGRPDRRRDSRYRAAPCGPSPTAYSFPLTASRPWQFLMVSQ